MLDVLALSVLLSDTNELKQGTTKKRSFQTIDETAEIQSLHSPNRSGGRKAASAAGSALNGLSPLPTDGASSPVRMHYKPESRPIEDDDEMNMTKSPISVVPSSASSIFRRSHSSCFDPVQQSYTRKLSLSLDDEMEYFRFQEESEELIGIQFLLDDTMDYSSDDDDV